MRGRAEQHAVVLHPDAVVDHRTCWRGDQLLTVEARCDPDDVVSLLCTRRSAGVHQRRILAVDGRGGAIRRCRAPSTAGPPVVKWGVVVADLSLCALASVLLCAKRFVTRHPEEERRWLSVPKCHPEEERRGSAEPRAL